MKTGKVYFFNIIIHKYSNLIENLPGNKKLEIDFNKNYYQPFFKGGYLWGTTA